MTVTVVRSSSSGPFQVDFATEGVTANAGEDYEETMGVLEFKVGGRQREPGGEGGEGKGDWRLRVFGSTVVRLGVRWSVHSGVRWAVDRVEGWIWE